jgi:hypothetical protein
LDFEKKLLLHMVILAFSGSALFGCRTPESSKSSPKVVGGQLANENQFPASFFIGHCSAVKVGARTFMTAAHCVTVDTNQVRTPSLHIGDQVRIYVGVRPVLVEQSPVKKIWISPDYLNQKSGERESNLKSFDVALVRLENLPAHITTASLDTSPLAEGETILFTGYGCTRIPAHIRPGNQGDGQIQDKSPGDDLPSFVGLRFKCVLFGAYMEKIGAIENNDPYSENEVLSDAQRFSGCPGDSGSAVYKAEKSGPHLKVVGVNSYVKYQFSGFARMDGSFGETVSRELSLIESNL